MVFPQRFPPVIMSNGKISLCTLPMEECSGGPRTFDILGYFLKMKYIWSEQ